MAGRFKLWRALFPSVGLLLLVLSGCGSSSSSTSSSAAPSSSSAAAATATSGKPAPHETIGFLNVQGSAPTTQAIAAPFYKGAKILGWDVKSFDAQGDPAKMAAGVQGFVTQGVNAIVALAIPSAPIQQALEAAKQKGIPVILIASTDPDPQHLYAAQDAPDDTLLSHDLTELMIKVLGGKGNIVTQFYPQLGSLAARDAELKRLIKGTNIKIVATHTVDEANPVQDTLKSTTDMLQANPNVSAVWGDQDFELAPEVQVVNQIGKEKNIKVFGFYPNADSFAALRKGLPAYAEAAVPVQNTSWQALDQLVNYFVNKKPIGQDPVYKEQLPVKIITHENAPSGDTYPWPDLTNFYVNRWKQLGLNVSG